MTDVNQRLTRYNDARRNADSINNFLDEIAERDQLSMHPFLDALYSDVSGLLAGMSQGTITNGQPRLIERLITIVQNYPNGKDPSAICEAIAACSERGLAAESHLFPKENQSRADHCR